MCNTNNYTKPKRTTQFFWKRKIEMELLVINTKSKYCKMLWQFSCTQISTTDNIAIQKPDFQEIYCIILWNIVQILGIFDMYLLRALTFKRAKQAKQECLPHWENPLCFGKAAIFLVVGIPKQRSFCTYFIEKRDSARESGKSSS